MQKLVDITLPTQMNALVLEKPDGYLKVKQVPVPNPKNGQVLVKIDSSPINPSDNSFIRGLYSSKKPLPVIPGFEGSGIVVATGDDFMSRRLLGRSVACFAPSEGHGTWAEYMLTKQNMVIPLKKGIDLEQGSMLMVNPLSVMAMLDISKKGKHKAIANTAAASALGQLMNRLCLDKKITLVNIVRREEQVKLLKDQGAEYVISSSSPHFADSLKSLFGELKVSLAFDAIAGPMTFDLFEALPSGGEVMIYGGLSEQPAMVHPGKLIFEQKKLTGFWASEWIANQSILKLLFTLNKIQKYFSEEHKNAIQRRVSLEETMDGISQYLANMTAGKVLVKPGIR